jgi:hypothetical protein
MANTVVTLALDGEPTLDDFAKAIESFRQVVTSLTNEVAPDAGVQWVIDDLERSSAIASVRGVAPDSQLEHVEDVVHAFERVGAALQAEQPVPFAPAVAIAANELTTLLNGRVTSVRLETAEQDYTVYSPQTTAAILPTDIPRAGAYGAVEGRVQTISNRGGLRFTLFDLLEDKAVSCYLEEGRQGIMTDVWGRIAVVEGWVKRDGRTGRPRSIRRVRAITLKGDGRPGDWREARGAVPIPIGALSAEDAIGRIRDGG